MKKKKFNYINEAESYGWVVEDDDAFDAYEFACNVLGKEYVADAVVNTLSYNDLASSLAYLFRMWDFHDWDEREDVEEFEEEFYESRRVVKEANEERHWVNTDITNYMAMQLKHFLRDNKIKFESSGVGRTHTHFEVFATKEETDMINDFIDSIDMDKPSTPYDEGCHSKKRKSTKKRNESFDDYDTSQEYEVVFSGTCNITGRSFTEIIHVFADSERDAIETATDELLHTHPDISIDDIDRYDILDNEDEFAEIDLYGEGCHERKKKSTKKRKTVKEDIRIYDAYGVYISSPEESYVIWSRDKNNAKRAANYISKLTKDPYFDPYEEADTLEELCFMVQDDMQQQYGMNLYFNDVSEIEMSNDVISVDGDNLINILKYFDFGY